MKIIPSNLDRNLHGLFTSAVLPRPIAFVSTVGEDGVFNLAPFSFFNQLCLRPAILAVSIGWKRDGQKKDTLKNIEFLKEFVLNVATETLADAMNQSSADYPSDVDEFKEVGLTPVKADLVKAPMVAESPVNMECRLVEILKFGEAPMGSHVVLGEVILVHVKDELWNNSHIEVSKLKPIGRLGEDFYCRTKEIFEMKRPKLKKS